MCWTVDLLLRTLRLSGKVTADTFTLRTGVAERIVGLFNFTSSDMSVGVSRPAMMWMGVTSVPE